jgi:hypothetical protein
VSLLEFEAVATLGPDAGCVRQLGRRLGPGRVLILSVGALIRGLERFTDDALEDQHVASIVLPISFCQDCTILVFTVVILLTFQTKAQTFGV